jgi:ribosome-associated translation inhibitor RaiA
MSTGSAVATVQVTRRGQVDEDDRAYALEKISSVLPLAHAPVLSAHLVLGWEPGPATAGRAHLEVGLDVNGVPVRAHITADSMREGVDLLQERLRRRLVHLQDRSHSRSRGPGEVGDFEQRSRAQLRRPPERRENPDDNQEVVRRKTFALRPLTPDEALQEMDLLDHDFYLYIDVETGADVVLHRGEDGSAVRVTTSPRLTELQAVERLDLAGEPFVFYRDEADGRARVLYRRRDGRYGLITDSGRNAP